MTDFFASFFRAWLIHRCQLESNSGKCSWGFCSSPCACHRACRRRRVRSFAAWCWRWLISLCHLLHWDMKLAANPKCIRAYRWDRQDQVRPMCQFAQFHQESWDPYGPLTMHQRKAAPSACSLVWPATSSASTPPLPLLIVFVGYFYAKA